MIGLIVVSEVEISISSSTAIRLGWSSNSLSVGAGDILGVPNTAVIEVFIISILLLLLWCCNCGCQRISIVLVILYIAIEEDVAF